MSLLNTKEAARYIGVSVRQVQYLAQAGELHFYRPLKRKMYFKQEWLDEYMDKNTIRAV